MAFGSSTTIDPNPIYTGGSPAARKSARAGSGVKFDARLRKKKPDMDIC